MSTADLGGLGLLATQEAMNQVWEEGRTCSLFSYCLGFIIGLLYAMTCSVFCASLCTNHLHSYECFPRHLSIPGVLGTVARRCTLDRRRPLVTAGNLPSMLLPFFQPLLADACLGSLLPASVFHNVA